MLALIPTILDCKESSYEKGIKKHIKNKDTCVGPLTESFLDNDIDKMFQDNTIISMLLSLIHI